MTVKHRSLLMTLTLVSLAFALALACESDEGGGGGIQPKEDVAADAGGDVGVDGLQDTAAPTCPEGFWDLEGEPCAEEGMSCGGEGCTGPCQPCAALICTNGIWERREAYPPPDCGDVVEDVDADGQQDTDGGGDDCAAAVEGEACATDGLSCGGEHCTDPCSFCNIMACEGGVWVRYEAHPDPSCGECPDDFMSADGDPCLVEGQVCGGGCTDPCSFCNTLTCQDGTWIWMEIFPDPACEQCPAEAPIGEEGCHAGLHCEWGEECCCGECHPSLVCDCVDGGMWGCYYTDACMIPECPPPEGKCHDHGDCDDMASCVPPYSPQMCGMCMEPVDTCANDADCGDDGSMVCETTTEGCLCSPASICVPACAADGDCLPGERCDDGHCVSIPCEGPADCPTYFTCPEGPLKLCERAACQWDMDCGSEGICVNGACYDTYGTCELPVP